MRYAIFALLIVAALSLGGCSAVLGVTSQAVNGSGNLVTKDFDFATFDTIDAGSNFKVKVQRGDSFAVKVTADDNMIDHLKVTSGDGKLTLGLKPGSWSLNNVTIKADVTMPALKSVVGRDNAVVEFDRFEPANFTLNLSGNAIATGEMGTGKLDVEGSGNGQARLAGAAESMDVRGLGNAIFTLPEMAAGQVKVNLNNNAMASVQATQSLDYSLNGNAGLTYTGGAKLGQQFAGANSWARQQ